MRERQHRWKSAALAALVVCFITAPAFAQRADNETQIRQLIRVFYVPDPNATTGETLVSPDEYLRGRGAMDLINLPENAPFRGLLDRLFGPATAGPETLGLQAIIVEILQITHKPIAVYLVNDRNSAPTNVAAMNRWGINLSGGRTWPAGKAIGTQSFNPPGTRESSFYGGSFTMGNWHLTQTPQFLSGTSSNIDEIAATFCHELMHTQDLIDWRTHLPGLRNLYGGSSGGHFLNGAIPNVALAYAEGIANFTAMRYTNYAGHTSALNADAAMRWFVNNGDLAVEQHPAYGDLYQRLTAAGVTPYNTFNTGGGTTWGMFHLRDVPAPVRIHSEMIVALILHHYAANVGFHQTMSTVQRVNPVNYLVSTLPLANLIGALVRDASRNVRFFPIALVDYFTSYTAKNAADIRATLEGPLLVDVDPLIDQYFATMRQNILTRAPRVDPAHPSEADIVNIAMRLGINSSPID